MNLEDRIRKAAAEHRLTGLTVWLGMDGRFEAGFRIAGGTRGYRIGIDADPVTALHKALDQAEPPKPKKGFFD